MAACRSSWTPVERKPYSMRSPAAPATIETSWRCRSGSCTTSWSRSMSMCAAVPIVRPRATIESFCAETVWPIERVTTACEASCTAMIHCSALRQHVALLGRARRRRGRSPPRASPAGSRVCFSRTVSSAASLITLASSAPLKPGVSLRDVHQRRVGCQRPRAAVQLEDLEAAVHVGHVDRDLAVEAAGTQQRGVEDVRAVGRAHHHDARVARRSRPSPPAAGSASARARRCPARRPRRGGARRRPARR